MAKIYLEELSDFIKKAGLSFTHPVKLECKHFFSGAALYVDKRICVSLTPVGLAMKLPEKIREDLFKNKGAIPLRYFPKGPIKKDYVLFPEGINGDLDLLYQYVHKSIGYVLTQE